MPFTKLLRHPSVSWQIEQDIPVRCALHILPHRVIVQLRKGLDAEQRRAAIAEAESLFVAQLAARDAAFIAAAPGV